MRLAERLEQPAELFLGHADAGVGDGKPHHWPIGFEALRHHGKPAVLRELAAVAQNVEQALLELVESTKRSLLIVAFAAYKIPELVEAINTVASVGANVVCVFESHDASGGKISFSPVKQLGLAPSVHNFVWPMAKRPKDSLGRYGSLHAKCAVVDSTLLFLSSANLTEFAFNLNMELGVLIKGGSLPRAVETHFHTLIAAGYLERIVEQNSNKSKA